MRESMSGCERETEKERERGERKEGKERMLGGELRG